MKDLPPAGTALTPAERLHYSRHLLLPEFGLAGQLRLKNSSLLLIGAGGLSCPAALYLAAAGVGQITILDPDTVEVSNLQRQIAFTTADLGRPKALALAERLRALNPHITVTAVQERFSLENALALVRSHDAILDGCDNFDTRYLSNDACHLAGKPLIFGAISRFQGQVSVFHTAAGGPCYRCLFPSPPAPGETLDCAQAGVLGVLPAIIGSLQATEAIKFLAGLGDSLQGSLLTADALTLAFMSLRLPRDPDCPLCGQHPSITELHESHSSCAADSGRSLSPRQLQELLVRPQDLLLLDVREELECDDGAIPGARHIPLSALAAQIPSLAHNAQAVIVYCRHGERSRRALRLLEAAGLSPVYHLQGGYQAWLENPWAENPSGPAS